LKVFGECLVMADCAVRRAIAQWACEAACMRAWIGFHDQLVLAWLADRSVSEFEVLALTLQQLDHLAADVLSVELDRNV
jgi:hypothetical protein